MKVIAHDSIVQNADFTDACIVYALAADDFFDFLAFEEVAAQVAVAFYVEIVGFSKRVVWFYLRFLAVFRLLFGFQR